MKLRCSCRPILGVVMFLPVLVTTTYAIDCNLIPDCGSAYFSGLAVGPSTFSPGRTLHVKSGTAGSVNYLIKLESGTGSNTGQFIETTLNGQFGAFQDASSNYSFQIRNSSNVKFHLGTSGSYDGRVGLGTTTPGAYLHILPAATGFPQWTVNGWRRAIKLDANGGGAAMQFVTPSKNFGVGATDGGGEPLLYFWTTSSDNDQGTADYRMVLDQDGNVGIGTTNPSNRLDVNGTIKAKEILVTTTGWPDYVFGEGYELMPLDELDRMIKRDGHLPGVPSAVEVEAGGGVAVGTMQATLLKKVEELTLYVVELEKQNQALHHRLSALEGR
jgi:hypothetical protein